MAFKSKVTPNVGLVGSKTTVSDVVASGKTHTVIGMSLANKTTSGVIVSAELVKNGGAVATIVANGSVPVGTSMVAIGGDQKLVLETGDSIRVWSSASSAVDVIISYLE